MAKAKSKAREAEKQAYFVLVPYFPIYGLFLLACYIYLGFIIYAPNALPWFIGSYLTEFGKYLEKTYSFEARRLAGLSLVGTHLFEVIVAVIISKLNGLNALTTLKWALQTSFYGIFSLRFLLALQFKSKKPEKKKK